MKWPVECCRPRPRPLQQSTPPDVRGPLPSDRRTTTPQRSPPPSAPEPSRARRRPALPLPLGPTPPDHPRQHCVAEHSCQDKTLFEDPGDVDTLDVQAGHRSGDTRPGRGSEDSVADQAPGDRGTRQVGPPAGALGTGAGDVVGYARRTPAAIRPSCGRNMVRPTPACWRRRAGMPSPASPVPSSGSRGRGPARSRGAVRRTSPMPAPRLPPERGSGDQHVPTDGSVEESGAGRVGGDSGETIQQSTARFHRGQRFRGEGVRREVEGEQRRACGGAPQGRCPDRAGRQDGWALRAHGVPQSEGLRHLGLPHRDLDAESAPVTSSPRGLRPGEDARAGQRRPLLQGAVHHLRVGDPRGARHEDGHHGLR